MGLWLLLSLHMSSNRPKNQSGLLAITWPLLADLVLGTTVGLIGLWMAAQESDSAAAAFTLANHVQASFFLLFRIIGMGVSVVITQNLGANHRDSADATARAALGASTWLGLFSGVVVAACSQNLLLALNAPPDVMPLAEPFLRLLSIALALDALNATMGAVMRAHMHTRDTLLNMMLMHSVHLVICVMLMYGIGPLPPMGMLGFAVAAALSRLFAVAFHGVLWRWRLNLAPHLHDWWKVNWKLMPPVLHIGLPGAAENIAYRLALLVTVAMVANMGTDALAEHGYTMQIMFFILVFSLSVGFGSEILVGHLIGARNLHKAHHIVVKSVRLGIMVSLGMSLIAVFSAGWTLSFFTNDRKIIEVCTHLLWIAVLLEPGRALNLIVINALRATGDARFPVVAGIASMIFVMAGGAWLLGVYFGMGLIGVWIAYALDEWTRGLIMCWRWWGRGWLPAARTTHRRLIRQRMGTSGSAAHIG
jgi:putative MATE family efflux protein